MLKVDFTLLVQIFNFLCLLYLLNVYLYKPINKIIKTRAKEFNQIDHSADIYLSRVDHDNDIIEAGRNDAVKHGIGTQDKLKAQGISISKTIINDTMIKVESKITKNQNEHIKLVISARESLQQDIPNLSALVVQKFLGKTGEANGQA
jgi:F0F1-type ATP synthase, subunit b